MFASLSSLLLPESIVDFRSLSRPRECDRSRRWRGEGERRRRYSMPAVVEADEAREVDGCWSLLSSGGRVLEWEAVLASFLGGCSIIGS